MPDATPSPLPAGIAALLAICTLPLLLLVIVAFETRLARAQWSKEDNRDNVKTYNKRTREGLFRLAPGFDWKSYLDAVDAGAAEELIVAQPSYFTAVAAVEGSLGEAVGKMYVARHFPPDAKRRMDVMVKNIIAAYGQAIRDLDWMSPSTKQKALAKLAAFNAKISYPNKWRDYPPGLLFLRRLPRCQSWHPATAPGSSLRPSAANLVKGGPPRPLRSPVACTKA